MSLLKKQNSFEEQLREQIGDTEWKPSDSLWSRIEQGLDAADSFEPALKNKLDAYTQEPRKEVWEKIENELPEPPKRRGLFWFSTVAVMLLVTFGAGYWFREHTSDSGMIAQNKEVTVQNNLPQTSSRTAGSESKTAIKLATPQSVESAAERNIQTSGAEVKSEISAGSNQQQIPVANIPASVPVKTGRKNNRTVILANDAIVSGGQNGSSGTGKTEPKQHLNTKSGIKSVTGAQEGNNTTPPVNGNNGSVATTAGNSDNNGIQAGAPSTGSGAQVTAPAGSDNNTENKPKAQAPIVLESVNINQQPKDSFSQEQIVRGSTYLAPDEEFSRFSLSAMAGVHMSFMKLLMPAQNDYNMEQSLALRKDIESAALDFSGSLQLNYMIGKNTYITTGIGIISFKQNVEFAVAPAVNATPSRVQPVNRYIHPADTITSGTGNTYENKYSFTEIPLYIGYKFPSESRMHFEVMGGISYARLNLVNAVMPDPSGVGMLMCDNKSDFPGFKDVFFATLIPGATFMLNSSTDLGLMAPMKMSVNNMVDNSKWVGQKPGAAGFSILIRKRF